MSKIIELVKERGTISRAELAKRLRMSERDVRMQIHDLNLSGIPLVFTGSGFVYAKDRATVKNWARNQKNAALSILKKVAAVTKSDVEGVARGLFT